MPFFFFSFSISLAKISLSTTDLALFIKCCEEKIKSDFRMQSLLTSICTLKTPLFSSIFSLMTAMAWFRTESPSVLSRVVVVITYRGGAIRLIYHIAGRKKQNQKITKKLYSVTKKKCFSIRKVISRSTNNMEWNNTQESTQAVWFLVSKPIIFT